MRKRSFTRQHIVFLVVAVIFMLLIDRGLNVVRAPEPMPEPVPPQAEEIVQAPEPELEKQEPEKPDFAPPLEFSMVPPMMPEDIEPSEKPAWVKNAVPVTIDKTRPRVVIIIDDMGMDRKHTREATNLPGPLTFAFLPYAGDLKAQTEAARAQGHELMVHMPMEPVNQGLNAGPDVLKATSAPEDFEKTLQSGLDSFDGYVGINNHMGSRMTQDRDGMARVMAELKKRGLLFVDSKTISTSVGEDEARAAGIPHASRDVFLDHEETSVAVHNALDQLEREARKKGVAIAIGHPKAETIAALREWIPTLKEKGIDLIPVSAAVTVP